MKTLLLCLLLLSPAVACGADRLNIVFMLSDDQGWNGLSVAMHPDVPGSRGENFRTPSLEKLAAQGMRFSAAYAPAPVCSPTRVSLMTGKSPARMHWTKAAPPEEGHPLVEPRLIKSLAASETTIAELLRSAGYATAHYGKWHLRGGGPGEHGFEEHDGDTGNEHAFEFQDPNPVDIFGMADRAAKFMETSSRAGRPFFIQMSWNALHASENALRSTLARYQRELSGENAKRISTAAITEDLDTGVGRVLRSIDDLGLAGTTCVVYMSDNGSAGGKRNLLRGGKGGLWEGGLRVPLIIRGPEVAPGSWCHTPVVGYDLFPTFCEWAGLGSGSLPQSIEGSSLVPLLRSGGTGELERPRGELVFHFPHYQGNEGPQSAIIVGNLKLLKFYEDNRVALFDLENDLGERNDLAPQRSADARSLRERLETHLAAIGAQLPTTNPSFDPSRPAPARRGQRGSRNRSSEPKSRR